LQTFLPYPDFAKSAACLDYRRLGKQRVECLQILRANLGLSTGWRNHPAARMWRGCEDSLVLYGMMICTEWRRRGYVDTCFYKINELFPRELTGPDPPWLGDHAFHAAHRSNLLRKDPAWYGQFGWTEPSDLPYVWPNAARF
jgi:hypothetical protein